MRKCIKPLLAELIPLGIEGFENSVGEQHEMVAGLELDGARVVVGVIKKAQNYTALGQLTDRTVRSTTYGGLCPALL